MNPIPLSQIRSLAVEEAIAKFGENTDEECAARHPHSHNVFDRLPIPLLRYRTCEHAHDCIEELPPLPVGISSDEEQGKVVSIEGAAFVVLENHKSDINEMVLASVEYVDASN